MMQHSMSSVTLLLGGLLAMVYKKSFPFTVIRQGLHVGLLLADTLFLVYLPMGLLAFGTAVRG
jgi:hypothetical protein